MTSSCKLFVFASALAIVVRLALAPAMIQAAGGTPPATQGEGSAASSTQPIASLQTEFELLESAHKMPDELDADYFVISDIKNSEQSTFNGAQHQLRRIQIAGKKIIFDKTADIDKLYERVAFDRELSADRNLDIEALTIYAETVVIKGALCLPGTNVHIQARTLEFLDISTTEVGHIDTTPLARRTAADAATKTTHGMNGVDGENAGNITITIGNLLPPLEGSAQPRFILCGGTGQDGGVGRTGTPGTDMPPADPHYPANIVFIQQDRLELQFHPDAKPTYGTNDWPGNGGPGIAPGRGGVGGNGGLLQASLDFSKSVIAEGGSAGKTPPPSKGGRPGKPNPALKVKTTLGPTIIDAATVRHNSRPGSDTSAEAMPQGFGPQGTFGIGKSGSFSLLPQEQRYWLHPLALHYMLDYAKDAYLLGNYGATRNLLSDLEHILSADQDPRFQPDFDTARLEVAELRLRANSGLDYFGHPGGWVPHLSLDAMIHAFEQEADADVRILYLSARITHAATENRKDQDAMRELITRADGQIKADIDKYNDIQTSVIPALASQADEVADQEQAVQASLQQMEANLEAQAQHDVEVANSKPFWSQALHVISIAASVAPVYQPALGAIGRVLDVVSDFNPSRPLDIAPSLAEASKAFNKSTFSDSKKDLDDQIAGLEARNSKNAVEYARSVAAAGGKLAKAIGKFETANNGSQPPRSEVDAQLQQLKAMDPRFNQLVDSARELMGKRQALAEAIAHASQSLVDLTAGTTKNLLAIDSLNTSLIDDSAALDQQTCAYVADLDRRAKDRLRLYNYYMAKAYEYRMLKPYSGDVQLGASFQKVIQMLTGKSAPTANDFKDADAVFAASIREIITEGLKALAQNPPQRSFARPLRLRLHECLPLNENLLTEQVLADR